MARSGNLILKGAAWTFVTYAISMLIRLGSNVALSHLLAPELIGVIVIVNTIRVGVELFSDLGFEQNVVGSPQGRNSDYLNTIWTMQIIRGGFLTLIFALISPVLAATYRVDATIFYVVSLMPLINAMASTSIFTLVKDMQVRRRYTFEIACEIFGFIVTMVAVYVWRDVWAIIIGMLSGVGARSLFSYFLPHPAHRPVLIKRHAWEIFRFGRWIMLSSVLMYASVQIDKIYLGNALPFEIFGIYGLARTIADLPSILAGRLCYQIFFPVISASKEIGNAGIVKALGPSRLKLLLMACCAISIGIAWADYAVWILYDPRYAAAGWMLSLLLISAWFAVLSSLNEAILLSRKPAYQGISNVIRLIAMAIGLYLGTRYYGMLGAIGAVIFGEICRYIALAFGQRAIGLSFARQDVALTGLLVALTLGWTWLRLMMHLGTAWSGLQ